MNTRNQFDLKTVICVIEVSMEIVFASTHDASVMVSCTLLCRVEFVMPDSVCASGMVSLEKVQASAEREVEDRVEANL